MGRNHKISASPWPSVFDSGSKASSLTACDILSWLVVGLGRVEQILSGECLRELIDG
jgi:hypothetical protein